jgi:tetratricopeptide (TPR) repeat protein
VFYAQSWAMAHYLLTDEGRRDRTGRFLAELRREKDPVRAFRAAFEGSLLSFELELERYVESASLPRLTVTLPDGDEVGRPRALSAADADAALGALLISQGRTGDARDRFERALAADRSHTRALAGMGQVHLEREDLPLAVEWLEVAVAAGGRDEGWLPPLLLGEALARVARESLPASRTSAPASATAARAQFADELRRLERARMALGQALDREADLAPALAALGRVRLIEGSLLGELAPAAADEAVAALRRAIELQPERIEPASDLALVLCRADRCSEARRVVEELLPLYPSTGSRDLVAVARELVARVELDRAARLASASRPEAALERLETLLDALDGETLSALGAEIEAVAEVASHNLQVAAYNHALDLAQAGRVEEALEELQQVLRQARDRELLDSARRLDSILRSGTPLTVDGYSRRRP